MRVGVSPLSWNGNTAASRAGQPTLRLCRPSALHERARRLRERVMGALLEHARASERPNPELRARTAFGLIAEPSGIAAYQAATAWEQHAPLAAHLLELAIAQLV